MLHCQVQLTCKTLCHVLRDSLPRRAGIVNSIVHLAHSMLLRALYDRQFGADSLLPASLGAGPC